MRKECMLTVSLEIIVDIYIHSGGRTYVHGMTGNRSP